MTTPGELREKARTLRDAARTMRDKAPLLDEDAQGVITHYPHASDGVWWGTAATTFYDMVKGAKDELTDVSGEVLSYARSCENKADDLEDEADRLEREQAAG